MSHLEITCPYCQARRQISHDGIYTPRYATCGRCGQKFIYEPRDGYVAFFKMGEADCCSDPDCRAIEMSGHCEQ